MMLCRVTEEAHRGGFVRMCTLTCALCIRQVERSHVVMFLPYVAS